MDNPPRLVIDLPGDWNIKHPDKPASTVVKAVRLGHHPDKLRLVLDLSGPAKGPKHPRCGADRRRPCSQDRQITATEHSLESDGTTHRPSGARSRGLFGQRRLRVAGTHHHRRTVGQQITAARAGRPLQGGPRASSIPAGRSGSCPGTGATARACRQPACIQGPAQAVHPCGWRLAERLPGRQLDPQRQGGLQGQPPAPCRFFRRKLGQHLRDARSQGSADLLPQGDRRAGHGLLRGRRARLGRPALQAV